MTDSPTGCLWKNGSNQHVKELSDEELLRRVRGSHTGDLRAFDVLVERYQDRVMANCTYLSGSSTDAEDLTQEVFVKAYFGVERFEGRSQFYTWLQRIKVNHCLNFLKKSKRRTFVDVDAVPGHDKLSVDATAEEAVAVASDREMIDQVLAEMTETLRVPLVLCDMDGLPYQEIAERLEIGLSATKMRIKRGREEFRRLYEEMFLTAAG